MKRIVYKNCKVGGVLTDIEVTDGIFTAIGALDDDGIDLSGNDVFPGLVDIHTHGSNGHSVYGVNDAVLVENLKNISTYFAKNGITSWCPTTCAPAERLKNFLSVDFLIIICPHLFENTPVKKSSSGLWPWFFILL